MADKYKNTVIYLSGGQLGDFIHQLSVICEVYYKYKRKGILLITNHIGNAVFHFSLEDTYNTTKQLIESQEYIQEYRIYNGEQYDIDLSRWRYSEKLFKCN